MNSNICSRRASITPAIRFFTAGAARAISGAKAAIGHPVSACSQCSGLRYHRTNNFRRSAGAHIFKDATFFPAVCRGYPLQGRKGFFAKLGIARLDGFGEKLIFAAEMFVKAANREARRLHHGGDAGPIQAFRPKSTSSVLQDSLVSSRLVLLFVSHISIRLYT